MVKVLLYRFFFVCLLAFFSFLFLSFFFFFKQGLIFVAQASLDFSVAQAVQTHHSPPTSTSQMLGIQGCVTIPDFPDMLDQSFL